MVRGLEYTMCKERLWKMSLFREKKRRQRKEDLVTAYSYLTGGHREDRDRFSQRCTLKGQDATDTSWSKGNSA